MLPGLPVPENEPPIPEVMYVQGCMSCGPKGPMLSFLLFCVEGFYLFTGRFTLIANNGKILVEKVLHADHNFFFGKENVRETDPIALTPEQYEALSADENRQVEISWGGGLSMNGPQKTTITHPFFMDE